MILISGRSSSGVFHTDPRLESHPCRHSLSSTRCAREDGVEVDRDNAGHARLIYGGTTAERAEGHSMMSIKLK